MISLLCQFSLFKDYIRKCSMLHIYICMLYYIQRSKEVGKELCSLSSTKLWNMITLISILVSNANWFQLKEGSSMKLLLQQYGGG